MDRREFLTGAAVAVAAAGVPLSAEVSGAPAVIYDDVTRRAWKLNDQGKWVGVSALEERQARYCTETTAQMPDWVRQAAADLWSV